MAGCKRCALKGKPGQKEKKKRKEKEKGEKMGIKIVFFNNKSVRMFFFSYAHSGHFIKYIRKTVSRLS